MNEYWLAITNHVDTLFIFDVKRRKEIGGSIYLGLDSWKKDFDNRWIFLRMMSQTIPSRDEAYDYIRENYPEVYL